MDTAKEELQSTNEELNTVNDELQGRNEELSRVNSDLTNLLASVQIAMVMVSSDLKIRRFTPLAEKLLNLIPGDVGRSIGSIQPNINCPNLEKLLTECIDTMSFKELEVQDGEGKWYGMHIRPYKDIENRIDGGVLTLFDIDAAHRLQQTELAAANTSAKVMREARDYAEAIINTVRHPLVALSADLTIKSVNKAFCEAFGVSPQEVKDQPLSKLGRGQWNIPDLQQALTRISQGHDTVEEIQIEHTFPDSGLRRFAINARRIIWGDPRETLILLAMEDVTKS